jgi:hypothetical protein
MKTYSEVSDEIYSLRRRIEQMDKYVKENHAKENCNSYINLIKSFRAQIQTLNWVIEN